ncbi:hypothetical protein [Rhodopirellula bahusiensis]|uniref:hypothetical protein n=1 Tax=Rhodopirellula bahusiensis TaxID=2014065 RepID=UPI00326792A4
MIEDGGKNSVPEASEDRPVAKGNTRPLTDIVKSLVEPVAFGFENAIRATNNGLASVVTTADEPKSVSLRIVQVGGSSPPGFTRGNIQVAGVVHVNGNALHLQIEDSIRLSMPDTSPDDVNLQLVVSLFGAVYEEAIKQIRRRDEDMERFRQEHQRELFEELRRFRPQSP